MLFAFAFPLTAIESSTMLIIAIMVVFIFLSFKMNTSLLFSIVRRRGKIKSYSKVEIKNP
jgi:hypothetical protein